LGAGFVASLASASAATGCGDDGDDDGAGNSAAGIPGFEITPAPGGARLLTTSQMQYSAEYLLGPNAAVLLELRGEDPQLHGFEVIAAAELALASNEVSTLESVATLAIDTSLIDLSTVARFAPCVTQAPQAACYDEVATQFGRVAWRRPVEEDEKARLVAIANQAQAWGMGNFNTGLKYQLLAILQSPNFLYMVEVGEPVDGRMQLTPYEQASRMAFFLTNQTPDLELLDAAESGRLGSEDGIREQARRLLALPEARRSMDRFYSELYFIRDLTNVGKDPMKYPEWNDQLARSMQEEMLRFIQDVVWTRNADARELFTSQDTFVDPNLAPFYGVPGGGAGWTRVTLPADQGRFGLIGKAGFLARFAHPGQTSPTRRGRFFWEKLMCEEIPPPPPGVDATLPEEQPGQHTTMRERLVAHQEIETCASCHQKMDMMGLTFEHFDTMGRFRVDDGGLPIDTSGSFADMSWANTADVSAMLGRDERATACIVKNLFRQSMGHMETDGEAMSIELLTKLFEESGYRVQEALVDITVNPAFRLVGDPK
jgi:hypothetical protein